MHGGNVVALETDARRKQILCFRELSAAQLIDPKPGSTLALLYVQPRKSNAWFRRRTILSYPWFKVGAGDLGYACFAAACICSSKRNLQPLACRPVRVARFVSEPRRLRQVRLAISEFQLAEAAATLRSESRE